MKKINRLQVIFKTAERCNIACKYCYYFFAGDESFKDRPAVVNIETVNKIANFLNAGLNDIDIDVIEVVFHGGEPLLQKKRDFEKTCLILKDAISAKTNLMFTVQTNGMLIDDEWVKLFNKFNVYVGVSLDGDAYHNDLNRIDHKGRGTYHRVVKGLEILKKAFLEQKLHRPGIITVINHQFDYNKIIEHIIDDLGIDMLRVLLPDMSHDDKFPDGVSALDYGNILIDIFNISMMNPQKNMYPMFDTIDFFQEKHLSERGNTSFEEIKNIIDSNGVVINNQIIVIQSDGEVSLDDSFIPALQWRKNREKYYVDQISLKNYLDLPVFSEINDAYVNLPKECQSCTWVKICKGGDLENRYKEGNGFDQPSVFCEGLKIYYEHIVTYLYKNGYPRDALLNKLSIQ